MKTSNRFCYLYIYCSDRPTTELIECEFGLRMILSLYAFIHARGFEYVVFVILIKHYFFPPDAIIILLQPRCRLSRRLLHERRRKKKITSQTAHGYVITPSGNGTLYTSMRREKKNTALGGMLATGESGGWVEHVLMSYYKKFNCLQFHADEPCVFSRYYQSSIVYNFMH